MTKLNYIKICTKASYAIRTIKNKFNYTYTFGLPSQLLSYDASGASDTWAMMVAKIPYAYTVELGPTSQESYENIEFFYGFHVEDKKIKYIVERAYAGLRDYMKTFVFKINKDILSEIDKQCAFDFDILKKNSSGYWN
ncbi:unnamed protein product [Brachionus calyciflorus]|uniref:Peptidase M14 domain-containing protein n=1 Tax=Brachionus calyciflorus TaxID=104777 RepID=A0A814HV78_9BILA|nr:unnamed protein product [Brachionus calyciflorus]